MKELRELVIQPFIGIYAVSKQRGLLPNWAFSAPAVCHVAVGPYSSCNLSSVSSLAKALGEYLKENIQEVDMPFEEVQNTKELEQVLGVNSLMEMEKKTVFINVFVRDDEYELSILGRAGTGRWDYNQPYALDLKIPKASGLEALAQAIVDHIQSRKDLPDERVIGVSPTIAKGA